MSMPPVSDTVSPTFLDHAVLRYIRGYAAGGLSPRLMTNVLSGDNNVSTMRFILALMVLWSHSFAFYFDDEKREPIALLTRGLYNAGNVGVACFLIMSGALVLRSWETSRSFRSFLSKRARRLYPAYIVAVFFGAFVVAPIYAGIDPLALFVRGLGKWLIANIVFLGYAPVDDVFVNSPITVINGSLWSIRYEVTCYLGLVVGAVLLRHHLIKACWAAMIVLIGAKVFADVTGWNPGFGFVGAMLGWPYLWFSVAGWFVTGMLFYLHRDAIPRHRGLLLAIAVVMLGMIWLPADPLIGRVLMDIFYTPMLAYGLFYICSKPRIAIEHTARTHDLSYGMYLYAFPIQQIILAESGHRLGFPVYVVLSVICTLLVAWVSWTWIEKRFVSAKPVMPNAGLAG
jgi:peptidoglycan/LPS O-acetylase OafA/YrhL